MNNLRKAQAAYDAMTPDDPLEYRESKHYFDWITQVTNKIVDGDESYGICCAVVGGHDDPEDYVYENIDDSHYLKYCESQRDYD